MSSDNESNSDDDTSTNDRLLHAVRTGNTSDVRELTNEYGLSYKKSWLNGYTLLKAAVEHNHLEVAKLLLDLGAEVNLEDFIPSHTNCTPLDLAAEKGYTEMVELLLSKGALLDYNCQIRTPLHRAVGGKSLEVTQLLMRHNATVNARTKTGKTPLHIAIRKSDVNMTKYLISCGANVHLSYSVSDDVFYTPLHEAAAFGYEEIAMWLLSKGASVHATSTNGTPLLIACSGGFVNLVKLFLDHGADRNLVDSKGKTALHIAAKREFEEIAKLLLSRGACVNATSKHRSPLHLACSKDNVNLVKLFLEYGADTTALEERFRTILQKATQKCDEEIKDAIQSKGVSVDAREKGNLPVPAIFIAAEQNRIRTITVLLEHGADVNALGCDGNTILCLAIQKYYPLSVIEGILKCKPEVTFDGNRRALKVAALRFDDGGNKTILNRLLAYGLSVRPQDTTNQKLFHTAIQNGYTNLTIHLLHECETVDAFMNVKCQDEGLMSLHVACKYGRLEIVEELIKYGSDVNAKSTGDFKPPIYFSVENDDYHVTKLLLSNNADIDDNPELLYIAVAHQNIDLVKLLLQNGAFVGAHCSNDKTKTTVLHFAINDCLSKRTVSGVFMGFKHCFSKLNRVVTPYDERLVTKRKRRTVDRYNDVEIMGEIVQVLLNFGANINSFDERGKTPIWYSIDLGYLNVTNILLANDAIVKGYPYLFTKAVKLKSKQLLEDMLKHGSDINGKDDTGTALHYAVLWSGEHSSNLEIADYLLCSGADINAKNNLDQTPLHLAVYKHHDNMATLLLMFGADVNACDGVGKTPIYYSIQACSAIVSRILLAANATVNDYSDIVSKSVIMRDTAIIECLLKRGANPNGKDLGEPPLIRVLEMPNQDSKTLEMVELLLKYGADVDAKNYSHMTPLKYAILKEDITLLNLLIDYGANINQNNILIDKRCGIGTPLILSASLKTSDMTQILLRKGAHINAGVRGFGYTALHIAVREGRESNVDVLLEEPDLEIDCTDVVGNTALHYAAKAKTSFSSALKLLRKGFDVNLHGHDDKTPLHFAILEGRRDTVSLLLKHGAILSLTDVCGHTPMHCAAQTGYSTKLSVLLKFYAGVEDDVINGFDDMPAVPEHIYDDIDVINLKDITGRTPLHYVVLYYSGGNEDLIRSLLDHGADINEQDEDGNSPLHFAATLYRDFFERIQHAQPKFRESVKRKKLLALVERGAAEVNLKNKYGRTALAILASCKSPCAQALQILLDYGAEVDTDSLRTINSLHASYSDTFCGRELIKFKKKDFRNTVKCHLIKLHIANEFSVNKENMELLGSLDDPNLQAMQTACKNEIAFLKESMLGEYRLSFYDILTKKKNRLSYIMQGECFPDNYTSDLPQYGKLIRARCKMLERRFCLLTAATECFKGELPFLPDLCIEVITEYLQNEDLKSFVIACQFND